MFGRCGILCYFSDEFYKKFKGDKIQFFRFREDLQYISRELIYSGCVTFAVGGTSEYYADFLHEFFSWCFVIGSKVTIEIINDNNYLDYLIDECDQVFIFWNDDENWDGIAEKLNSANKEWDLYDMDSVTDEYRNFDKYLELVARQDAEAFVTKEDKDYLKRYNIQYELKKNEK